MFEKYFSGKPNTQNNDVLLIFIENDRPVGYPVFLSNLKEQKKYKNLNIKRLPKNLAIFIKTPFKEKLDNPYQTFEKTTYEWTRDGKVEERHHYRQLTACEKKERQEHQKKLFKKNCGWKSWTFNEETCEYDPPIPLPPELITEHPTEEMWSYRWDENNLCFSKQPDDGGIYEWNPKKYIWMKKPEDGNNYYWNNSKLKWVKVKK